MSAQIDCPICMDCIETSKNCVTTECGHCFHASCLMKSVAHNGFGCPYCRTAMAEEPDDDDDDEEEEEDEEEEMFDENALRGFRFFWNILNGEEHDEDDDADEQQLEEWADMASRQESETDENVPTTDFVAQKLRQQGVTYEQLVSMICFQDHEEFADNVVAERFGDELFGKIRIIVSNYTPEQASPVSVQAEPVPQPVQAQIAAPIIAEPKVSRRIMLHV
jgi:hypothetical protein